MNSRNFGYSLKNIPVPQKVPYMKALVEKTESFLKRMRWRAHFFTNDTEDSEEISENFGFKSRTVPPQNAQLTAFENDMYELVRSITFKNHDNEFQQKLKQDVREIRSSSDLLIPADKTTNLYDIPTERYLKLLNDNITKTYRKSAPDAKRSIDIESKLAAQSLAIDKKMECYAEKPAYVTLKDHKENFKTKLPCRLINPAKNEIGVVSKTSLASINKKVLEQYALNQWRNTSTVIEWFRNIQDKSKCKFIKFDIEEFYPSISENLLNNAISFAQTLTEITPTTINIIKLARKSLLFDNNKETWVKKGSNPTFDVTMGCFDGAETCELVGLYMLNKLSNILNIENIGLYRDDGLAVVKDANGPKMDRMRKDIISTFKEEGLSITIETNLSTTDFLDVSFDLATGKYFPYRKPNSNLLYVNKQSNHPPTILKELPKLINQRLTNLSCDETEFNKAKSPYQDALKTSGYKESLQYEQPKPTHRDRNRKRKIIWFNPPYNMNVRTNIGKKFLQLIRKHFPKGHQLNKIFNMNTIKLSYSCTPNIQKIITQHNHSLMNNNENQTSRCCNCRSKPNCPMNGECLTKCIVYKASIKTSENTSVYYGASEGEFKTRFNNHTKSFKHSKYRNDTELSKLIWKLKEEATPFEISWEIESKAFPYKCGTRRCDLCLAEKVCIICAEPKGLLNKRTELLSRCRHRNKYIIANIK